MTAPTPADERARLVSLRQYDILDTLPEQEYDDIARLAAQICGTPIALINLLDEHRQWFKSKVGVCVSEAPRRGSLCDCTILQQGSLIVPDTARDARFADHPWIKGEPFVRFYAGAPLRVASGQALGSLCVADYKPRRLNADQRKSLDILSQQVVARMELKRSITHLERLAEERCRALAALQESERRFASFMEHSPAAAYIKDEEGRYLYVNEYCVRHFQKPLPEWIGRTDADLWPKEVADRLRERDLAVLAGRGLPVTEDHAPTPAGKGKCWLSHKFVLRGNDGRKELGGLSIDITDRKLAESERERLVKQLRQALAEVKTLAGLLPICSSCKNIRDDAGYWQQIENYLAERSNLEFTHGICPDCMERLYPESARTLREAASHPYCVKHQPKDGADGQAPG